MISIRSNKKKLRQFKEKKFACKPTLHSSFAQSCFIMDWTCIAALKERVQRIGMFRTKRFKWKICLFKNISDLQLLFEQRTNDFLCVRYLVECCGIQSVSPLKSDQFKWMLKLLLFKGLEIIMVQWYCLQLTRSCFKVKCIPYPLWFFLTNAFSSVRFTRQRIIFLSRHHRATKCCINKVENKFKIFFNPFNHYGHLVLRFDSFVL